MQTPLAALVLGLRVASAVAQDEGRRRGQRQPPAKPVALRVGTIHPVSGPEIRDGVILIQNGRIAAIGPAASVPIPEGAEIIEAGNAHAYPGLVDVCSTLYVDSSLQQDATTDAGSDVIGGLDGYDPNVRAAIAAGITTAYVSSRSAAVWRGTGAIVRPTPDRIVPFPSPSGQVAAVAMRVAAQGHPLERQKALQNLGDPFDQLEAYEKGRKEHQKAVDEYKKKYDEYLAWHRARNPAPPAGEAAASRPATPAGTTSAPATASAPTESRPNRGGEAGDGQGGPGPGRGGRRFGGRQGGTGQGGPPPSGTPPAGPVPQDSRPGSSPQAGPGTTPPPGPQGGQAPQKPTYPKAPPTDPAKEALLRVTKGELPLRIEAQQADEVRAALRLARDKKLKRVVIEGAADAGELAKDLADAGVPIVLTGLPLPEETQDASELSRRPDREQIAARLHAAGVTFALGSGSGRQARFLPLVAAAAAGQGLAAEHAIRAITLSAAEVLGIARDVGSLDRGKLGDVLLTSGPLLASDTRVLRVVAGGQTLYEAK